ncbi:MAG TPA: hypothetical protein VIJ96_09605 [Acidothermaceae bacterium]
MPPKGPDLEYAEGPFRVSRTRRRGHPDTLTATFEDPEVTPYRVRLTIRMGTEIEVTHMSLEQLADGPPITAAGLREVPLWSVATACLGWWTDMSEEDQLREPVTPAAVKTARTKQNVIDAYLAALRQGSRSPTADAARATGYERSSAGRILVEARRQGALGPAVRGRAGIAKTDVPTKRGSR